MGEPHTTDSALNTFYLHVALFTLTFIMITLLQHSMAATIAQVFQTWCQGLAPHSTHKDYRLHMSSHLPYQEQTLPLCNILEQPGLLFLHFDIPYGQNNNCHNTHT